MQRFKNLSLHLKPVHKQVENPITNRNNNNVGPEKGTSSTLLSWLGKTPSSLYPNCVHQALALHLDVSSSRKASGL